jgi:tetrathionate reductase subunit C
MMEVQTLPNYDAGPYPYSLPIGPNGLLGILGMLGLWLAIATVVTELLNVKQSTHTRKNHAHSHEALSNG